MSRPQVFRMTGGDGAEPVDALPGGDAFPAAMDAGVTEDELDTLLASWAAVRGPTFDELDTVRRAVLAVAAAAGELGVSEAVLPAAWWRDFFRDLQASLQRASSLESVMAAVAGNFA